MNAITAQQVIEAFAINAEIAGMQAANQQRLDRGYSLAYDENAFQKKADELRSVGAFLGQRYAEGFAQ